MDKQRRVWLKRIGVSSTVAMPGTLLGDEFAAAYEQAYRLLVGNATVKPDSRIELHVPEDAANGAVVPLGVESLVPGTLKIVLLVDNHVSAKVAEFDTSNKMMAPRLSTHLQLQQAATITALIKTKVGWHSNSAQVKALGENC